MDTSTANNGMKTQNFDQKKQTISDQLELNPGTNNKYPTKAL